MHHLHERLHENGIGLVFSGLKKQVLDVMRGTGLFERVTQANIFPTEDQAISAVYERMGDEARDDLFCPVRPAATMGERRA
jgi:SulP family sulfate permease